MTEFKRVAVSFKWFMNYWTINYRIENGLTGCQGTLNLYAGHYSREAAIREASRKYNIEFPAGVLEE